MDFLFLKSSITKDVFKNYWFFENRSALYNNSQAKQYVDAWFVQVVRPFTALVQITGHNRARQRDKWAHILEDLSALQEEVCFLEYYKYSCYLTWIYVF